MEDQVRVFGRLVRFDKKNRRHPVMATIEPGKGRRNATWNCDIYLDQGSEGSCVGHAWAHELAASPGEVTGVTHGAAVDIYYDAQHKDPWIGGAYPGAAPYYEGSSVLAGAQSVMEKGFIGGYQWAFGLEDLIMGLGYTGPAVLGIGWYEGMRTPARNGLIRATGNLQGGHAIMARAVDVDRELILLHNSWGQGWSNPPDAPAGTCWITFEDMDKLLKDNGEAVFAMDRKSKPIQDSYL